MKHDRRITTRERRTLVRTACALPVVYRAGSPSTHDAVLAEVGHGGLRLRTQRALVPGHFAMICTKSSNGRDTIELKARTVWCHFDPSTRAFVSGLRVLQDASDTGARIAELVYDALEQSGATAALYEESSDVPLAWTA